MKITYVGPHDEVEIPALDYKTCKRGETIDVPDKEAEAMVKQEVWEAAKGLPSIGKSSKG